VVRGGVEPPTFRFSGGTAYEDVAASVFAGLKPVPEDGSAVARTCLGDRYRAKV
jgi:hypothetical protein